MNNKHINAARLDIWVQLQVLEDAARNARLSIERDRSAESVGRGLDDVDRASVMLDRARVTYNTALGEALGEWADGPPEGAEDVIRQWLDEQGHTPRDSGDDQAN